MAKKKEEKTEYDGPLKIKGKLEDVLKASFEGKPEAQRPKKEQNKKEK